VFTSRRQVLINISQIAMAATLASCSKSTEQTASNTDLELLASVTYDILPFAELPATLYVQAAQKILDLNNTDVTEGIKKLREVSQGKPWKDVAEADRVAALTALRSSPFFAVIRSNTLQVILRNPATFDIVGYGGSAIEKGGYISRGFGDINWLPAAKNN
jgi:hypothetical protein